MKTCLSETIGTFFLVFSGTGAIIVNDVTGGTIGHVGISLTFGLVVMVLIYALGEISGAHFNPAVTLGFWLSKRLPVKKVLPYLLSQCSGALLASLLLKFLFPTNHTLGLTTPHGTLFQSFTFEFLLTCLLTLVILNVTSGSKEKGLLAGIAIGGTVGLEALFGGPISGASMNPARSLGPAIISGNISVLWIYIFAPVLGAVVAVLFARYFNKSEYERLT